MYIYVYIYIFLKIRNHCVTACRIFLSNDGFSSGVDGAISTELYGLYTLFAESQCISCFIPQRISYLSLCITSSLCVCDFTGTPIPMKNWRKRVGMPLNDSSLGDDCGGFGAGLVGIKGTRSWCLWLKTFWRLTPIFSISLVWPPILTYASIKARSLWLQILHFWVIISPS